LQDWLKNGWLVAHEATPQEVADLLGVARRDLQDAQTSGLSADWRLSIAYNAALQLAVAALAAAGYRASRDAHHYRVIESLAMTIGADRKTVATFDAFRKKRNQTGYERAGMTSEQEVKEMLQLAQSLHKLVSDWLEKEHPELI
jgi:cell fate (sporulation/competence/biofilm development) regulator YlbF (YheA/YmcA/DUF963 family)